MNITYLITAIGGADCVIFPKPMRQILLYAVIVPLVLAILRNPFAGILAYTGINIVRPEMLFWGGAQGSLLHKLVFISLAVSYLVNRGEKFLKLLCYREVLLLFWMCFAVVISLNLSEYPLHQRAYYYAMELCKLALFGTLLAGVLLTEKRILIYERFYLGLFSFLALWGIDQHFRGNVRLEDIGDFDSNGLAAILVLALPLGLNLAISGASKLEKYLGVASTITLVLAVIFTQSRGGLLGMAVCMLVLFLRSQSKKKFLMVGAVTAALVIPFLTESYVSRMSTISSDREDLDYSAASRIVLWQAGLMLFKDNPVFGAGLLTFPIAVPQYKDRFGDDDPDLIKYTFNGTKVSHSTYVQMLSEGGLFLFIPYLWLILGTLADNRRTRATTRTQDDDRLIGLLNSIEAGIWGFCFSTIFINSLTMIFLPIQVIVSRMIRERILAMAQAENSKSAPLKEAVP